MPGEALAKAAGAVGSIEKAAEEIADPELAAKVERLKQQQRDEQVHELTELEALKVENLALKKGMLDAQHAQLEKERFELTEEIRERLEMPKGTALIVDPQQKTVRQKPKE